MSIQKQVKQTTIRNLAIFIIVVLASGWLGRGLDILMGNPPSESLGMLLWLITPLITSLLLRAFAGDGWKDLGLKPNFKGNGIWYAVAILIFPVSTALTLVLGRCMGLITCSGFSMGTVGLILQAFAMGLIPQFFKNIFEEGAWRGYLAPKVYSLGLNKLVGHVIVGLVWGAWHIPYYLFFLDRSVLQAFTTLSLAAYIPLSIIVMICWSIVFGEVRLLTRSVWPAVLLHMVEDALLIPLFTAQHIQIIPGTDWLVSPMHGLLASLFFVAVGMGLRYLRKRKHQLSEELLSQ